MILLDTSGLFAFLDESDRFHAAASHAVEADPGPFFLSPFVLAELDYFVLRQLGADAELALLADVADGRYELALFDATDVASAARVADAYHDAQIGLTDASIVVLAGRHDCEEILTLDERHFRALRTPRGGRFRLLPADL